MSEAVPNFEGLLHRALSPVDPPEDLTMRLEGALASITESAVEELEAWELSAMRDPRNWVRPVTAVVVGGSAGAALVLLRARRRATGQTVGLTDTLGGTRASAQRAFGELAEQTRRLLG